MREDCAIAAFALWKSAEKFYNATPKINRQSENGSELDHDCVHFPKAILQIDMQQRLADSQVRGRTYRKKFSQSLDNSEEDGKQIVGHFGLESTRQCHVEARPSLLTALPFLVLRFGSGPLLPLRLRKFFHHRFFRSSPFPESPRRHAVPDHRR